MVFGIVFMVVVVLCLFDLLFVDECCECVCVVFDVMCDVDVIGVFDDVCVWVLVVYVVVFVYIVGLM